MVKTLNKRKKDILKKAKQIIQDRKDAIKYESICKEADICHKCGGDLIFEERTDNYPPWIFAWTCSNDKCKYEIVKERWKM